MLRTPATCALTSSRCKDVSRNAGMTGADEPLRYATHVCRWKHDTIGRRGNQAFDQALDFGL